MGKKLDFDDLFFHPQGYQGYLTQYTWPEQEKPAVGNHTSTLSSGQHSSLQHVRVGVRQEGYRIGVDEEHVCLSELLQCKVMKQGQSRV